MASAKRNTVSLILVLLSVGGAGAFAQGNAAKTSPSLSNTRSASCIVNVTVDPEIVPLTPRTAEGLVLSSAVAIRAARDTLAPDEVILAGLPNYVKVEWLTDSVRPASRQPGYGADDGSSLGRRPRPETTPAGPEFSGRAPGGRDLNRTTQQNATLRLVVMLPPEAKPAAEEFLRAMTENLSQSLLNSHSEYLGQLVGMIATTDRQRENAQEELNQQMGIPAGSKNYARIPLEPDGEFQLLRDQKRGLENQIQERKMNLIVTETRRDAIEKQIAELHARAAQKAAEDTVAHELETIIKGDEEALQNTEKLVAAGRVSEADMAKARESLARARIDLAKRREELASTGSGGQLEGYTSQISSMAIQTAEEGARMQLLSRRLEEVEKQLASMHDPSQLLPRVRMAQELVNALDLRIGELKMQQTTSQQPTVTVIGAN
jgi:hypothetical protein